MAFTTNGCESLNAVLKKVDYKRSNLLAFIHHLKEIINEQDQDVERAIFGHGTL